MVDEYVVEEYQITDEDVIEITWEGESRTVRAYTRGTADPLYTGDSFDAAAEALDVSREYLDQCLMGDPIVRNRDGDIIS